MRLPRPRPMHLFLTVVLFLGTLPVCAAAEEVVVFLRNGRLVTGDLLKEESGYLLLRTDLGELTIQRPDVARLTAAPFAHLRAAPSDTMQLNDQVVVYLKDGKVTDGYLVAKSRTMIMIRTEDGRLTIPKKNVQRIEYVWSPYAEEGEPVIIELTSGKRIEGYLSSEDALSLSVTTSLGKLAIEKKNLRSVEYGASPSFQSQREEEKKPDSGVAAPEAQERPRGETGQRDLLAIGYSASWGRDYDQGITLLYGRRFPLRQFRSMSLGGLVALQFAYFGVDQGAFTNTEVPGGVSVSGYGFLPTLILGAPIEMHSQTGSPYRFVVTPQLNVHLVTKSLEISYPSFPDQTTKDRQTQLRLGVGVELGMEWNVSEPLTVGVSYNPKVIFGEADFSTSSAYVTLRPLFWR